MKTHNFLFEGDEESPDYMYSKSEDEKNLPLENDAEPIKKEKSQNLNLNNKRSSNIESQNKSISDENNEIEQNSNKNPPDVSEQIAKLKSMIDSRNQQFEAEFEELKRKHQAKLKSIKQNHITREQTKSNAYDLEYRNLIWTTTLRHLDRGCFTEDLRLLFQQAISNEQYRLEKELIKLKQKNDEEIQIMKDNLPKIQMKKQSKRSYINLDILDPIEMARIIYNNCFPDNDVDDFSDYEIQMIDRFIRKIQKCTMQLTSSQLRPRNKPLRQKPENIIDQRAERKQSPKNRMSPKHPKKDKYIACIETHQQACQNLEKSVKETDQFIKKLQEQDWFTDIFPHVD